MLVKQVFFRSMGVWMFAGALLGVETSVFFDRKFVNETTERAKHLMVEHLTLQLALNSQHQEWQNSGYVLGEEETMMTKVARIVDDGMKFYSQNRELFVYELDSLYDRHGNLDLVVKDFPSPLGVYAVKITRMKVFGAYLHGLGEGPGETVLELAERVKASQDPIEIPDLLSKIIAKFGELPFIHFYESFTDLPKTTEQVEWVEVKAAFDDMKSSLWEFSTPCPGDLEINLTVMHAFLQYKDGQINTSILGALDQLYIRNRFYRLAASETHNIYLTNSPDALDFTRELSDTIREVNRFASLLQSLTEKEGFKRNYGGFNMAAVQFKLTELGITEQIWDFSVLLKLSKVLSRSPGQFTALESLPADAQAYMDRLTKLFAEVEGSTGIYTTYYAVDQPWHNFEKVEKRMNYSADVRYLVALFDTRAEKLRQILQSEDAKDICKDLDKFPEPIRVAGLSKLLEIGASLCIEVERALDEDSTFYSYYHKFESTVSESPAGLKEIAQKEFERFRAVSNENFRMKTTMETLKDIFPPGVSL